MVTSGILPEGYSKDKKNRQEEQSAITIMIPVLSEFNLNNSFIYSVKSQFSKYKKFWHRPRSVRAEIPELYGMKYEINSFMNLKYTTIGKKLKTIVQNSRLVKRRQIVVQTLKNCTIHKL